MTTGVPQWEQPGQSAFTHRPDHRNKGPPPGGKVHGEAWGKFLSMPASPGAPKTPVLPQEGTACSTTEGSNREGDSATKMSTAHSKITKHLRQASSTEGKCLQLSESAKYEFITVKRFRPKAKKGFHCIM